MGKDKTRVCLYIRREVWEKFRKLVFDKYGKLYGGISVEAESMMKNWIAAHTNLTNNGSKLNPLASRSERYARDILRWIKGRTETFQVPRKLIVRAIEKERGSDPRTIKKWFSYLRRHGHIKPLGGAMWELC